MLTEEVLISVTGEVLHHYIGVTGEVLHHYIGVTGEELHHYIGVTGEVLIKDVRFIRFFIKWVRLLSQCSVLGLRPRVYGLRSYLLLRFCSVTNCRSVTKCRSVAVSQCYLPLQW